MKRLFLLFTLLFPSWLMATEGFHIQLSCSQMPKTLNALKSWTEGRGNSCALAEPISANSSSQECNADVSSCLPQEVKDFAAKPSKVYGPNCWNLALVMAGILPARRYTSREEMAYFMSSPLCREVSASEEKLPGDIGAFRAKSTDKNGRLTKPARLLEVHGFIWISEHLVYSKNGTDASRPYALYTRKDVEQRYRESQKVSCKEFPESCDLELYTMRCQSLDGYMKDPKNKIEGSLKEAFARLEDAEKCVSTLNFAKQEVLPRENILQSLQAVAAVFDSPEFEEKLAALPKEERNFVEGSISFRLNSMYTQMEYTRKRQECRTCRMVTEEIREASSALRE